MPDARLETELPTSATFNLACGCKVVVMAVGEDPALAELTSFCSEHDTQYMDAARKIGAVE